MGKLVPLTLALCLLAAPLTGCGTRDRGPAAEKPVLYLYPEEETRVSVTLDFDGELIKQMSRRGKTAVDVQALLRHVDKDTSLMYFEDWKDKLEYLPYIDYLKTDAAEAEIMTGKTDRAEAARLLHKWGAKEVVITHNTEVIAYDGYEIYACPIKARNLSGRSGRGDTTFAAYISEREHAGVEDSLLWATATVSAKMEKPGPYQGTRADIEDYIRRFYGK